jgi:hypothetical protein
LNRIKLMISTAFENIRGKVETTTSLKQANAGTG